MSYTQKIKNLLQKMKQASNYNNNTEKNSNTRNLIIYKNNLPLIDEEICLNNNKRYLFKKIKNKYQTSIPTHNNSKVAYIQVYENNKKNKYNNNFIIETNYENSNSKIINNKNINTINSYRNNFNISNISNQSTEKIYLNNNNLSEKDLLFKKINNHINVESKNISNLYSSNHKIINLNNSDYDIQNKLKRKIMTEKNLFGKNSKKRISSYILKDRVKDIKGYTNNSSPKNYSSYHSQKKLSKKPILNNDTYIININNSYKNITSRIVKRDPIKSLSELFNEERMIKNNKINYSKHKYLKEKLLLNDKGYSFIYDNEYKRNKFKRNCISSSNLRERDNHSGGKIILALDENLFKKNSRKIKTFNYYVTQIQSFWRGYMLRKLVKITKELFLLLVSFINKIKKIFDKYKKQYFLLFTKNINQYYIKNQNIKTDRIIKINKILYKNEKKMKKNITTPLLNKGQKMNNNEKKIDSTISEIKRIKIDNIFCHKKKFLYNKSQNNNKYIINVNKSKLSNSCIKNFNNNNNNLNKKRLIKRTSFKKFNNASPNLRNIELNINKSSKNSLYENRNNLNNYSSNIPIFFQTQFPDNKSYSLKNLVYVNKNKNKKHNIKEDLFKKIRIKIFNNFYLTLYKCVKKSVYRFYWNELCLQIEKNKLFFEFLKKRNYILKSLINNITNKIKKKYFRKYRENILVEIIKAKLFYLTDYSRNENNIFYTRYTNLLNQYKNRAQKLLEIYLKYNEKFLLKKYFSIWKINIYNNIIRIEFPLSSARSKYSKPNLKNCIKKIINYNIKEYNESNKKGEQYLIYKKNIKNNYMGKYERIPIKKNYIQNQSFAFTFYSPYNKYNKKNINNPNTIFNGFHKSNYNEKKNSLKNEITNKIKIIFDKINNKNLKNKYFNSWRTKRNIQKKYIKVNYRLFYFKYKFLKYFLLSLNNFFQNNNFKINNINKIGLSLFIWHRNTFNISKRKK